MAISRLLNSRSGKSIKLFDIVIERSFNRLRFSPAAKYNLKPGFCYNIPLNELVFIPELNRYFYLSEQSPVGAIIDNPLKKSEIVCTKSFIYHKMKDVQIRSRKMGDTINIRHIGHVKLKDYFVNNKIPKYERDEIGLLTCGSEVVWIMDKKSIVHADYEPDSGLRQIHIFVWEDYSERGYQDADFRERD
jgi:tRNA(Ile)-lysidine synthase